MQIALHVLQGLVRGFLMCMQVNRLTLRNSVTSEETTVNLSKEQEANESHYKDKETGAELEVIEKMPLLEWLASSYKKFGCQLEFVTNKSQVRLVLCSCAPGLHCTPSSACRRPGSGVPDNHDVCTASDLASSLR